MLPGSKDEIFDLLSLGANFDSKRFRKQVQIFEGGNKGDSKKRADAAAVEVGTRPKKKRKKTAENSDEVAIFGSQKDGNNPGELADKPGVVSKQSPGGDASVVRKRAKIKAVGSQVPDPISSFLELESKLNASERLMTALKAQHFTAPTPIQMQAIPCLCGERDVVGIAPTGSGKTLAFLLPLVLWLESTDTSKKISKKVSKKEQKLGCKAVVLSPTKELSSQTARVLGYVMPGDEQGNPKFQVAMLTRENEESCAQADILLSTPLRLVKLIEEGKIDLSEVRFLILDEADRLFQREVAVVSKDKGQEEGDSVKTKGKVKDKVLETGKGKVKAKVLEEEKGGAEVDAEDERRQFLTQIDKIFGACTCPDLVRALFSATFPTHVEQLANNVMQDPVKIMVGKKNSTVDTIEQHVTFVGSEKGKLLALRQLIQHGLTPPVLVFVDTKDRAKNLVKEIGHEGSHIACIHSDLKEGKRAELVDAFRAGRVWMLIATDLIGRGMDFLGVNVVVNYDVPKSSMDYIHRVGRTGRAGRTGVAHTFFTETDMGHIRPIASLVKEAGGKVPDWMLGLKKDRWKNKVNYGKINALPKQGSKPKSKNRKQSNSKPKSKQ